MNSSCVLEVRFLRELYPCGFGKSAAPSDQILHQHASPSECRATEISNANGIQPNLDADRHAIFAASIHVGCKHFNVVSPSLPAPGRARGRQKSVPHIAQLGNSLE